MRDNSVFNPFQSLSKSTSQIKIRSAQEGKKKAMERFMQLATANLNIRYECAKCLADLNLVKPLSLNKKYLIFDTIDEGQIMDSPTLCRINLCGLLRTKLHLCCTECRSTVGYKLKGKYQIDIRSVNLALREVAVKVEEIEPDPDALQADSDGGEEAQSAPELHYEDSQPVVEADLDHQNEAEAEPKQISEAFESVAKGEQIDILQLKVEPSISEADAAAQLGTQEAYEEEACKRAAKAKAEAEGAEWAPQPELEQSNLESECVTELLSEPGAQLSISEAHEEESEEPKAKADEAIKKPQAEVERELRISKATELISEPEAESESEVISEPGPKAESETPERKKAAAAQTEADFKTESDYEQPESESMTVTKVELLPESESVMEAQVEILPGSETKPGLDLNKQEEAWITKDKKDVKKAAAEPEPEPESEKTELTKVAAGPQHETVEPVARKKMTMRRIKKERLCYRCWSKDHASDKCRNAPKCFRCEAEGHTTNSCSNSKG